MSAPGPRAPFERVIVIGASLGGLRAIQVVLRALPGDLPAPIVMVQHRSRAPDDGYAAVLQEGVALVVAEAQDKDPLVPGRAYVAPADYHLLVDPEGLSLSTDAPVHHARPSIDVLFESAAHAFGRKVIGVVLTGSNADGAQGAADIKARGGVVVVQDPGTAEAPAMPSAVIQSTAVDRILPLDAIGPAIVQLVRGGHSDG